jgi:hypothetical protein
MRENKFFPNRNKIFRIFDFFRIFFYDFEFSIFKLFDCIEYSKSNIRLFFSKSATLIKLRGQGSMSISYKTGILKKSFLVDIPYIVHAVRFWNLEIRSSNFFKKMKKIRPPGRTCFFQKRNKSGPWPSTRLWILWNLHNLTLRRFLIIFFNLLTILFFAISETIFKHHKPTLSLLHWKKNHRKTN